MSINVEEKIITLLNKLEYMHENSEAQCVCNICHETEYIDLGTMSNIEFVNNLSNKGWTIINDTVYCPKCYEQYLKLNAIAKNNMRPTKVQYYLNIAKEVATRSTCLRRKYGAILINNDVVISTGYNGSPRGTKNCIDIGECRREKLNIPRGQCYEMCRALHAEQNCIINASRNDMINSDLYLYGLDVDSNTVVDNLD